MCSPVMSPPSRLSLELSSLGFNRRFSLARSEKVVPALSKMTASHRCGFFMKLNSFLCPDINASTFNRLALFPKHAQGALQHFSQRGLPPAGFRREVTAAEVKFSGRRQECCQW